MGKVLLVVDDSRTIRTAVELIFEGTEYRVVVKDRGEAGLAWMRTHTPDLILVDERMPDMDGYDFGTQIKAIGKNEDVPILLLACQDGPDETKADDADLDGYVNKPFGSQELVTLVEMLTGSSQISQMPLSFKEQLAQRTRDRMARSAKAGAGNHDGSGDLVDEQLMFEAELAAVARDDVKRPEPKKPEPRREAKKDEPVVEIPVVENEPEESIPPVRIELPRLSATSSIDIVVTPPPKLEPRREPKAELPKAELPKAELPKPELPKAELSKAELPKAEPPKAELPKPDLPKPGLPRPEFELPKVELPKPDPRPIPFADLAPPPRFPPPPSADLAIPLPPAAARREFVPPSARRPIPTPPPLPPPVHLPPVRMKSPPEPPLPIEPPEETVDEREEMAVNIEAPVEAATVPAVDPADRAAEEGIFVKQPPPLHRKGEPIEVAEHAITQIAPEKPTSASTSRGLLFALLALAVICGLVAFYFVSQ